MRKSPKRLKTAELLTQGLWDLGGGGETGGMLGSKEISYDITILDTVCKIVRNLLTLYGQCRVPLFSAVVSFSPVKITNIMLLYLRDSSSPLLPAASGSSTPTTPPVTLDSHLLPSSYDPHLSNLPFQIIYGV